MNCPENTWTQIVNQIKKDGYKPKTTYYNIAAVSLIYFDDQDNYGEYNPNNGNGGFGDEFSLEGLFDYVDASGGWREFDYYVDE